MLICHRLSSKCINVLHCDTDVIVPPVDIFTSNFRVLTLKTKTNQDRRIKEGKMGEREEGKEGERKEGKKKRKKSAIAKKKPKTLEAIPVSLV